MLFFLAFSVFYNIVITYESKQTVGENIDCAQLLRENRIALDTGPFLKLYPHVHGTDGFFAAVFARG